MDASEADSRFGATALRALDDALALSAREPRVALTQARKAVEAVALHLYARDVGDPEAAPKRLMLDDLLKALVKQKLLPEGVSMHFGTVQRYGNYGSHPQVDDASAGNTVAFNQPCIESLRFIARWYVKDKLRLAEGDVPTSVRALVGAPSIVPGELVMPASTGPRAVTSTSTPSTVDPFGLQGACLDGKYQLDALVAEGGFGAVYRGTHLTLEKPIALKVLKPSDGARDAFLQGFALEAKTIARLEHPAIVKVLDFGTSVMPTGSLAPWMVLEWLTGETLADDLRRRRGEPGRSPAEALALLRPALDAVAYAHGEGVAHRDIKPANLMLPAAPTSGPTTRPRASVVPGARRVEPGVKLLDFGIAKVMQGDETEASGHTHTRSAAPAFSLPYAAPEQVSGTRTGPWTDVHALALVLVETLVNAPPYGTGDAQALYAAALSPVRPTPARFGVDVGAWEPVLAKALSFTPSERYASAGEFLDALEADVPAAATRRPDAPTPQLGAAPVVVTAPPVEVLRGAQAPARGTRRALYVTAGVVVVGLVAAEVYVASGASREPAEDPNVAVQAFEPPTASPADASADAHALDAAAREER